MGPALDPEHILQTGAFSMSAWALGRQTFGELAEQLGCERLPEKNGSIFMLAFTQDGGVNYQE